MRKKLFATMFVAVVAAVASYNVCQSQNTNTLSDLALANVEALASSESDNNICHMNPNNWVCKAFAPGTYCYCNLYPND